MKKLGFSVGPTRQFQGGELYHRGYYSGGSPALGVFSASGELQYSATVALKTLPSAGCVWLKGWSENKGVPEALERSGAVILTGKTVATGYCHAQEAELLFKIENDHA